MRVSRYVRVYLCVHAYVCHAFYTYNYSICCVVESFPEPQFHFMWLQMHCKCDVGCAYITYVDTCIGPLCTFGSCLTCQIAHRQLLAPEPCTSPSAFQTPPSYESRTTVRFVCERHSLNLSLPLSLPLPLSLALSLYISISLSFCLSPIYNNTYVIHYFFSSGLYRNLGSPLWLLIISFQ